MALFAFARAEVGVDIEKIRSDVEHLQLADRFFSEYERAQLRQFSGRDLDKAFFRCWTRKEAYVKAKGGGLAISLTEFDVSLTADEPAALLATRPNADEDFAGHCTIYRCGPGILQPWRFPAIRLNYCLNAIMSSVTMGLRGTVEHAVVVQDSL